MTLTPKGKHVIVIGAGIGSFATAAAVPKLLSCDRVRSGRADMHQIGERTPVFDLEKLTKIYRSVLELCRMTGKILVLTAIDDELDKARAPEGVEVIYSGVGKVNAASAATLSLGVLRPSLVINYGTAGKINEQLRGLVEVAHVVQRDMMAMPLAPRGRTPFSSELDRLSSGHGDVICGTGDSFVTSSDPWLNENNIDIVDMELFAIAHVCQRHSVRWRALKFITDDANDFAAEHWTANVADGQELFWDAVKKLTSGLDLRS